MQDRDLPPCPVTGAAPVRLVQRVSTRLLMDLWRVQFGVDAGPSFKGIDRFNLWESPTGLYYFDPMLEGDGDFYKRYYEALRAKNLYEPGVPRGYFHIAAREVRENEKVLDVGCGFGGFRDLLPHASYLGLDPHFSGDSEWVLAESLEDHLKTHERQYDVACLFDVLEHLANPRVTVQDMARAVRPGGRVLICVPHVPSALTRIPNFLLNAPPHHLTWWTDASLRAVAAQAGLEVDRIVPAPWCEISSKIYWISRYSAMKTGERYFWHSWPLHASNAIAAGLGILANRIFGPPKDARDEGAGLLMFARKPA
jgi:SAM-dependent methyltransferase